MKEITLKFVQCKCTNQAIEQNGTLLSWHSSDHKMSKILQKGFFTWMSNQSENIYQPTVLQHRISSAMNYKMVAVTDVFLRIGKMGSSRLLLNLRALYSVI
jgi:hypothetical protein